MPRSHSTIFNRKKLQTLLQLKPQAELGLKASDGWNQRELDKTLAYPHVIVLLPILNISLIRSKKPIPLSGLQSTPTSGPRETQIHTCGNPHLLCLVAQESDIHISQHQI